MERPRSTLKVAGLVLAVIGAIYLVLLSMRPDVRPSAPPVASAPRPSAAPQTWQPSTPTGPADLPVTPEESDEIAKALEDPDAIKEQLANYLKANRYSPGTLRLTPDMTDVLHPDQPVINIAVAPGASKAKDPEDHPFAAVEPDTARFSANEKLGITFRTFLGREAQTPTQGNVRRAFLARIGEKGLVPVASLDFKQTSVGVFRALYDPAKLEADHWSGYLQIIVEWQIPNGQVDRAAASVQYTGQIPAKFVGFRDELKNGSVVVTAELEVDVAGHYDISALLFQPGGEVPIAASRFQGELGTGKQEAPIEFYGLVFHDAKATSGKFEIRTVTGTLLEVQGVDSRGLEMKTWDGPYLTRAYDVSDLTSEEWTSPQKQLIVDSMKSDIARLEGQKPAP